MGRVSMDIWMVIHVACLVGWMGRAIFLFSWMDICWTGRDSASHFSFWLDGRG